MWCGNKQRKTKLKPCTQVKEVHEEEWSYIPVGGPLPRADQPITAFGAAANLVHPATGAGWGMSSPAGWVAEQDGRLSSPAGWDGADWGKSSQQCGRHRGIGDSPVGWEAQGISCLCFARCQGLWLC